MEEIVKHINDTNASYRDINAGDAKNTDLFLDQEHKPFFSGLSTIRVIFHKENLMQAMLFISSLLPRKYDRSSEHYKIQFSTDFVYDNILKLEALFAGKDTFEMVWTIRTDVPQKNGKIDERFYMNGLIYEYSYTNRSGQISSAKFTVRDYLAGGYSDIHFVKTEVVGTYNVYITNTTTNQSYDDGNCDLIDINHSLGLQLIFYGAPGTGKSNTIKREVEEKGKKHFRITFHPDSDYSTFVGCYKPTKQRLPSILTKVQLTAELARLKESGVTYPCQRFAAIYYNSLRELNTADQKEILSACGFGESFLAELGKGIAVGDELMPKRDSSITYEFVPQTFTKAYCEAWNHYNENNESEPVFLIIEEINRGNCAQIFGDIFQLLDRKNGFSEYQIDADEDLKKFLMNGVKEDGTPWLVNKKGIENGQLCLPPNLFIWATMNTSDQSLFPIDSAFKRRWDWQYMPICKGRDEKGNELNWKITADTNEYDWWSFLAKINDHINATTNSEDKKLGFFFCKPHDGCISSETFVGKVIFYLWNDVFKDFGFEGPIFKDIDGSELSFNKFYKTDDKGMTVVQKDKVELFLNNLGVDVAAVAEEEVDIEKDTAGAGKAEHKETLVAVTVNDERLTADGITQFDLYLNAIKKIGVDKIGPALEAMKYRRKGSPMATKNKVQGVLGSEGYSYVEADGYYFVKGANGYTLVRILEDLNKSLNLNIQIEYR